MVFVYSITFHEYFREVWGNIVCFAFVGNFNFYKGRFIIALLLVVKTHFYIRGGLPFIALGLVSQFICYNPAETLITEF
jgi:hypothetical protein